METPENKNDITYAEEVVVITGSILPGIDGLHPNTYGKVKSWQSLSLGPRPKVISSVVHFQYCTQRRSFLQVTYTLDEVWGRD